MQSFYPKTRLITQIRSLNIFKYLDVEWSKMRLYKQLLSIRVLHTEITFLIFNKSFILLYYYFILFFYTFLYFRYVCDCPFGFGGLNCSQELDECQSNPCQNEARCVDMLGTYHCECTRGWIGRENPCSRELIGKRCHLMRQKDVHVAGE